MPQREIEICSRVRTFRKDYLKWNMPTFAKTIGSDSSYISNLEHARTPLRFGLAYQLLTQFPLNPHWLATGEGPMSLKLAIPNLQRIQADERAVFSRVYDETIMALLEDEIGNALQDYAGSSSRGIEFQPEDPASRVHAHASLSIDLFTWLAQVPDARFNEFVGKLQKTALATLGAYGKDPVRIFLERFKQMERFRENIEARKFLLAQRNQGLTLTGEAVKIEAVAKRSSLVRELIDDVKALTTERGSRTRLAESLGVTPQRLNDWLSGEHEPSAETTLRLKEWVNLHAEKK